jgi:hypothetical protein
MARRGVVLGMCDAPRIVRDTEHECDANCWDSSSNNEVLPVSKEDEKRSEILINFDSEDA